MRFFLLIGSLLFATACTVETVKTNAPPEQTPPAEEPGEDPENPSNPTKPTNPDTPATPPTVKLDSAFTAIADATNKLYSAAPGPNNTTYVAFRKAGGAIGWGTGTILRRYLANGTLDASFPELTTTLVANPEALAVDSQGRVLIGGTGLYDPDTTSDTGREIVVVRVTSAGIVDTSYSGGRTKLSFSPANVWTTALHVRADGGAFVAVYGRTNGKDSFGGFLIGNTGTPVSGYGTNGFASSPFPVDGALTVDNDALVPTTGGLVRYGVDGKSKGAAIEDAVVMAKTIKDGFIAVSVTADEKLALSRYVTGASTKKDKTFVGPEVSETIAGFEVLKDGSVIYADGGSLSWVSAKGGTPTVLVKDAGAASIATTSDGKLLVKTSGDNAKVQRYTL